jgi:hypothetical protein
LQTKNWRLRAGIARCDAVIVRQAGNIMPRKDTPRTEPQSRRDRYDEADPRTRPEDTSDADRGAPDAETVAAREGQSGYGAGDGDLEGSGAWSGRENPKNASPGSGPLPNEGTLRDSDEATVATRAQPKKTASKKTASKKTASKKATPKKSPTRRRA